MCALVACRRVMCLSALRRPETTRAHVSDHSLWQVHQREGLETNGRNGSGCARNSGTMLYGNSMAAIRGLDS